MERMPYSAALAGWTVLFCAMVCSIGRVISCSTSCAVAPGHWQAATATRTGISGSLRWGIEKNPKTPHTMTPTRAAQAIWRCSTKKRDVFCSCWIRSASDMCGIGSLPRQNPYFLAVPYERTTQGHDTLARAQTTGNFNRVADGLADLDYLGFRIGFSRAFDQAKHSESTGIGRSPNHGAQRNHETRRGLPHCPQRQRADHAWFC